MRLLPPEEALREFADQLLEFDTEGFVVLYASERENHLLRACLAYCSDEMRRRWDVERPDIPWRELLKDHPSIIATRSL